MTPLAPILRSAKPRQVITLPRGVYCYDGCVHGDPLAPVLPEGVTLDGSGSILYVTPPDASKTDAIRGAGQNTVRNLHIEIEPPQVGDPGKRSGVSLRGPGVNSIDRVTVCGLYGTRKASQEAFGLVAMGGHIRRCIVNQSSILGHSGADYVSAICGPTREISWCSVIWPAYDWQKMPFWASYNLQDAYQLTLAKCTSFGGRDAVYSDWGDTREVSISRCEFNGCVNGLHLQAQNLPGFTRDRRVEHIRLSQSLIRLAVNGSFGSHPSCILLLDNTGYGPSCRKISGVSASNCVFAFGPDTSPLSTYYAANIASDHPVTAASGIFGVHLDMKQCQPGLLVRNKGDRAEGVTIVRV